MVLGDWNEDIQSNNMAQLLSNLGLWEAVTSIHHSTPPNTHNRGQSPTDGIFLPASWVNFVTGR